MCARSEKEDRFRRGFPQPTGRQACAAWIIDVEGHDPTAKNAIYQRDIFVGHADGTG